MKRAGLGLALLVAACNPADEPLRPPPKIIGADGRVVQECKTPDHAPLFVGKKTTYYCAFQDKRRPPRGAFEFVTPEKPAAVIAYYRGVAERHRLAVGREDKRRLEAEGAGLKLDLTVEPRNGGAKARVAWEGS